MTGPERRQLSQLINQAVRERLIRPTLEGHCKGCGIRFEETVRRMEDTGCWHCRDRIRRKDQRAREQQDPELRERRLVAQRERKRRRRHHGPLVRGCSGCGNPYAQHTEGCRACKERHARAARHRAWVTA